jgi:hypothetical protein
MNLAEPPQTRQESYFEPNEERLKKEEQRLKDDLELLLQIYLAGSISKILAFALGLDIVKNARNRIVDMINESAVETGLREITEISNEFLKMIADDLKKFLDGIEDKTLSVERQSFFINLLSSYIIFKSLADNTELLARTNSLTTLLWVIVDDEKTCDLCRENEGLHDITSLPPMPAHYSCRCFWILPGGQ